MVMAAMPVIGAVVGALLSSHLSKLYGAVGNLEDKTRVEELEQELGYIKRRIEEIVKNWKDMSESQEALVERMRLLVYDIEDLVDSAALLDRLKLSIRIKQIIVLVAGLKEHLKSLKDEEPKAKDEEPKATKDKKGTSGASPEHKEEFRPEHLQGMEERAKDVIDLVKVGTTSKKKKPKVVSIVGFGGMGKSLLALEVYNGVKEYPTRTIVRVGRRKEEEVLEEIETEFCRTKEELLKQQDKKLKGISQSDDGESGRKDKGKDVVVSDGADDASTSSSQPRRADEKEPRYFVVIDDVMEEQLAKRILSVLESTFPVQDGWMTVAVTVLLTTSVLSVAEGCNSDHVYIMKPLSNADSKTLFIDVARMGEPITQKDEELIKKIIMKCEGLPLALVSVAKFCGTNIDRWTEAWRKLGCPKEEDCNLARMQRVLAHSYTSLSSHPRQASLLYFSMFPHGHPVRKGSIIRRWLAEGPEVFCGTSAGGQPTDQMANATQCFETLVGRNVFWPHQDDLKTWKPHGLVLEYIKGMSGMLKFIMLACPDNDNPAHIRRLSLHNTGLYEGERILNKNLSRLRTLAVFRKTGDRANLCFKKCKMLRLLDLEACNGLNDSHLDEICKELHLLKYLSLGASITQIPRDIVQLQRLETLDLGKEEVVKVPAEVVMLPGLKHLLGKVELLTYYWPIRSDAKSSKVKNFCLEKSNLETLAGFVIAKSEGFPQLMRCLKYLKKVKIWCGPSVSPKNVEDVVASIRKLLARDISLNASSSLSIDFQKRPVPILDKLVAGGDPPKKSSWLKRIMSRKADGAPSPQNHRLGYLACLKLKGFAQLSTAPAFLCNLDIRDLCLSSGVLTWKDLLDGVSNLHTLEYLKVVQVDGEDKEENGATEVLMRKDKLQRLKRMCLVAYRNQLPTINIEDGALQSLERVHLTSNHLVGQSSFKISFLKKLKEVTLYYIDGSPESNEKDDGSPESNEKDDGSPESNKKDDGSPESNEKEKWKHAAREHPNTPQVLVIQTVRPQ